MMAAEFLDYLAKFLTVVSTVLYLLGYIEFGVFLSAVAAAAALMSTVLIHRMGKTLKRLAAYRRKTFLHRMKKADDELTSYESPAQPREILEKLLYSLLKIHQQLEEVAAEKMAAKTPARDILAISKARLEVVAKIKDVVIALEKVRPSEGEKDFSDLLRELVEQKPESEPTQSP